VAVSDSVASTRFRDAFSGIFTFKRLVRTFVGSALFVRTIGTIFASIANEEPTNTNSGTATLKVMKLVQSNDGW